MTVWHPGKSVTQCDWDFKSTVVYIIPKHWIHLMIGEICLGVDLVEALKPSLSGKAVIVPSWFGRSLANSMNCPNFIANVVYYLNIQEGYTWLAKLLIDSLTCKHV